MDLELNIKVEKIEENKLAQNFIKELSDALNNLNNEKELKSAEIANVKLTPQEEVEFNKKEFAFLQDYFKKELLDLSQGEIYIVTNKYENDNQYHRYKVAQYKNNFECKYIVFEKELPKNIKLGEVVRKINGKYIYDKKATQYVNEAINKIKQDIISKRKNNNF